jgi:hypothetical protein
VEMEKRDRTDKVIWTAGTARAQNQMCHAAALIPAFAGGGKMGRRNLPALLSSQR